MSKPRAVATRLLLLLLLLLLLGMLVRCCCCCCLEDACRQGQHLQTRGAGKGAA